MSHSQTFVKKYISLPTVVSSFIGMMVAVPLVFALNSSASGANAYQSTQSQSTAQVMQDEFAKFAYAYNQGYEARTVSASSTTPGSCAEATVSAASSDAGGSGAVGASSKSGGHGVPSHAASARYASMINSYNSYSSAVYNSSSVTNTNSNNTVGSHNVTKTEVDIEDAKGVMVAIDNSQNQSQVVANDSFNKDSYNTKTETTTINDSFNKETNVAINSGNTSETNNVTKVEDSYNTSTNTTTNQTTVTTTENKTIDSYNNETNIDVDLQPGHQKGPHYPSVI